MKTMFYGKNASTDLARVMALERPAVQSVAEVLENRRKLRVTLVDGSNVLAEGDDTDGFVCAMLD